MTSHLKSLNITRETITNRSYICWNQIWSLNNKINESTSMVINTLKSGIQIEEREPFIKIIAYLGMSFLITIFSSTHG
jgi:hypothetical protein